MIFLSNFYLGAKKRSYLFFYLKKEALAPIIFISQTYKIHSNIQLYLLTLNQINIIHLIFKFL